MGAEARQRVVDGARAMAKQRVLVARGERHGRLALLRRRNGRRLEERLHAVENGPVAGPLDVAHGHIGQPQMRVAGVRAVGETGAAVRRAMPPFRGVALEILMARMQQDLRPGALGGKQDERNHVLQLIAIARRARALRRPGASPEARGEQLIRQPIVDEPVEFGPVGLHAQRRGRLRPRTRASLRDIFARISDRARASRAPPPPRASPSGRARGR